MFESLTQRLSATLDRVRSEINLLEAVASFGFRMVQIDATISATANSSRASVSAPGIERWGSGTGCLSIAGPSDGVLKADSTEPGVA